ncbi:hypothetical protein [Aquibacillus kalidii]|uniref:hypothetical protein n=1 Tax=Aquibacillus kalidii TaxID=2762597 RepID=UPI00164477A3|nr:hypothetical protein [Aquibacillus kalidii]
MSEILFVILPWTLLFIFSISSIYCFRKKSSYMWGFLSCMLGIIIYLVGLQVIGGFEGMGISLIGALPFTIGLFILFILWISKKIKV